MRAIFYSYTVCVKKKLNVKIEILNGTPSYDHVLCIRHNSTALVNTNGDHISPIVHNSIDDVECHIGDHAYRELGGYPAL